MSNEFDFVGVVKHLDVTPTVEAPDGISQFRINKTPPVIEPVRDIKKIHYTFKIPFLTVNLPVPQITAALISYQFNYSAPTSFRILWDKTFNKKLQYCSLAVRYRVGEQAFRYFLGAQYLSNAFGPSEERDPIPGVNLYVAETYTNQLIKPNFVIEVWSGSAELVGNLVQNITEDLHVRTSKLLNPATADMTSSEFQDGEPVHNDLFIPFPEVLPTDQNVGAWLDNA